MATCPFCASQVNAPAGASATCPSCGARFTAGGSMPEEERPTSMSPQSAPPPPPPPPNIPEVPCPMCGEIIKAGAKICRFCKTPLDASMGRPGPAAPMMRGPGMYGGGVAAPMPKKSNCLWWVIGGVLGLVALVCIGFILAAVVFKDQLGDMICEQYLRQLHEGCLKYEKATDKKPPIDDLRGSEFVRKMAREYGNEQIGLCGGEAFKGRQVSYRGPMKPWSQMKDDDILACCPPGAHKKGVWVLHRNGVVKFAEDESDLYKRAIAETQD